MILVTGASGYVGKSFIETFQNKYKIKTFSLQEASLENLDLSNIDTIIHFAALVHQKKVHPQKEYDKVNVDYPVQLAQKAKLNGVKLFIYMSSVSVYGEDTELLKEDTPCHPVTLYGKSKLKAERKLLALSDNDFIVSVVRPPMIYGKGAPGNIKTLIGLIKKALILPFAGINNYRSFIYIGNLTYFIDRVIEKKINGIFLVADDKSISTTYLVERIAQELDKKIYLIKISFLQNLIKKYKPALYKKLYGSLEINNYQTQKMIKYKNLYTTEEGIKHMIKGEET